MKKDYYKYFVERCEYYLKKFKIDYWNITFKRGKLPGMLATANYFLNRNAIIRYAETYNFENKKEVDNTARHEIIHLIVGRYILLAEKRFTTRFKLDEELEIMIDRLTELLK